MDNTFLSTQNINMIYTYVRNDILQKISVDINSDTSAKSILTKLISSIYQQNKGQSVSYLNNLVLQHAVPKFIDTYKNKSNNIRGQELGLSNNYTDRVQGIKDERKLNNGDVSQLLEKRNFNTGNPISNNLSSRPDIQEQNNSPNNSVAQDRSEFRIENDYNQSHINSLLSSLEVMERPVLNDNKNNNTSTLFQKISDDRSYNNMVGDQDKFEAELRKSEEAQKMIFKKIQDNKNRKNEISELKNQRPELDFDPKQFYIDNAKMVDKAVIPQFQLESKDLSHENIIKEKDPRFDELLKNDWRGKDIKDSAKQSLEELYQPEGYVRERSNREFVLLDSEAIANNADASFTINLTDSLIIDKMCDVYLEFMSILSLDDGSASLETFPCFVLSIDELPMNTSSNISNLNNKYIIPNDTYGISKDEIGEDTGAATATSINVKLKSNYMSTITPQTFNKFTVNLYGYSTVGALTLLQGANSLGRVIIGLIFKKQ